jgi:hypothetical protein
MTDHNHNNHNSENPYHRPLTPGEDPTDLPLPANPFLVHIHPPFCDGYQVNPNQVFVFKFIVGHSQRIIFNVRQTSLTVQDYTLACWFSTKPYNPVLFYYNRTYQVHLLKRMNLQFAMQDINYDGSCKKPPIGMRTIAVEPGIYYYNVENLTGHINKFDFVFQTVDLGP